MPRTPVELALNVGGFETWRRAALPENMRTFSLGRHALVAALRAAGIGAGDQVLLPAFLCRDVLASLAAVGAAPAWYPVGDDLAPATPPGTWPEASAVLAVDYFGFAQPLAPFAAYKRRTGALIIEDNAHGFLSRDEDGSWLGTRGDIGIFSLRKTLPIADGALLAVNDAGFPARLPGDLAEIGTGFNTTVARRARVRRLPVIGVGAASLLTQGVRTLRKLRTGHAILPSDATSEQVIPYPAEPHAGLTAALAHLDVAGEIARRRRLYAAAERRARAAGITPLLPSLPEHCAPYGFPFRLEPRQSRARLAEWASGEGLELIGWPDLPHAVLPDPPRRYTNVLVINFLC